MVLKLITVNLFVAKFCILIMTAIVPEVITSSSPDMLFIRHGRSRVRHSNEKDHIRWGLQAFDNLTLDYDGEGFDNETFILFGNDLWSSDNGSYVNQTNIFNQTSKYQRGFEEKNSQRITTQVPFASVTSAIKNKLKKKKIMESIRKNVDKGLEYLKIHKNLEENLNIPITSQEFGYQNDESYLSLRSDDNKKYDSEAEMTTSRTVVIMPHKITNTPKSIYFNSPQTDNNLPHSIPTRFSISYKEQMSAREGEATHPELSKKSGDINNLNDENNDDPSASNILNSDGGPNQSASTSTSAVATGSELGGEDPYDHIVDITDNGDDTGYNSNDNSDVNEGITLNVYGTTDEDLSDLDEISRNNRLNLMKGRDVVTKFLQIVETQHLLGANCTAGTALNLGEGVVDQYAQDRFRIEAEVAVNRANMLTRIFKLTSPSVQASEHLLHASVLSMVEFDDDIFAAGNCFDWNQHPAKSGLFCPFAYRLPPPDHGASFAKDLAAEYHYLGNTSEWFFLARKNAEKVIAKNEQYIKAYHLYSNSTTREADEILSVKYDDGRWSKPYYDCGGGNIWMLTYTVPFFGYENETYFFKGTSGIDIDLRRVDIDQCPQKNSPGTTQPLNIFAGTDKCKQRTTMCEAITGLGFRRGSYKCVCRKGFYFPDTSANQKYFNGSVLEEEYEKLMLGEESTYSKPLAYECLPCAEGCDFCEDASPCVAALNWPMRTSILVLACAVIGLLPPAAWFTFRYQQVKVVRAASPALLRVIALGAFFIYCTTIVMYPPPSLYSCTARIWLREIGFSLTYGALMLKTWRISVIFRVRSAKAVKITDAALLKRLGVICGVICACLLVRTVVSPPEVVVGRTADDLKAFLCKTDWWDYTFTSMEVLFLAWGVRLCIMVRKAPSEFNESRFISMAIYNEFLLTCFLNVSMLFLQSPANPDLLYIIFFCHTQLTVTLLLGLIFGSKVYIVMRSGKAQENAIGLGAKSSQAKFNFRPKVRTFANPSTATSSTAQLADTKLSDQEALEEIRQLSVQLQRIQELAPPRGIAVMTISSLLDGLKTTSHQLSLKPPSLQALTPFNTVDTQKPQQKLQQQENSIQQPQGCEKSTNTELGGSEFWLELRCITCNHKSKTTEYSCKQTTACEDGKSSNGCQKGSRELSFSELQLDCMCSRPEDDIYHQGSSSTTAATPAAVSGEHCHFSSDRISSCCLQNLKNVHNFNTPCCPSESSEYCKGSQKPKFHSTCNLISNISKINTYCDNHKSNEHFLICDNCKNKFLNNKSIELKLDSQRSHKISILKTKSNDDISFHSSNDGSNKRNEGRDDDDVNSLYSSNVDKCKNTADSVNSDSENVNGKNSNTDIRKARNRKQDKPILDLNDRSKYTKEVSV